MSPSDIEWSGEFRCGDGVCGVNNITSLEGASAGARGRCIEAATSQNECFDFFGFLASGSDADLDFELHFDPLSAGSNAGTDLVELVACLLDLMLGLISQNSAPCPLDPMPEPISRKPRTQLLSVAQQPLKLTLPSTPIAAAKRYGNIYTVWGGPEPIVVLSGFETVEDALVKNSENFAGRPVTPFFKVVTKEKGIVFSNGHTWKQQRKFGLVTLRKLGLGKKGVENQVQEEAQQLVETFARAKGQPIDPSIHLVNAVSNVVCALVFGHRYSVEDEEFLQLMDAADYSLKFGSSFFHVLYEMFPGIMKHISWPYKKAFDAVDVVLSHARKEIEKHRRQLAEHDPRDYIDYYILQMEKSKNDPTSTYNEENLVQSISDLIVAGTDTTSSTLQWTMLLMLIHQDVQAKVQKEIEEAFGSTQSIDYQYRRKVPYTFATIHEAMRFKCVLLAGIPRLCLKDINILGSHIPKGCTVVPNVYSVLFDPKQWETPEKFNPNHFLDKNGQFVDREELLLFGAGARICVGKEMAKMEVFIFFTNLLRAFNFRLPEGVKEVSTKPIKGLTMTPQHYEVCAIPRNSNS
ncbi:cytochrome P450 2J2-like [Eublepharis macularius]|uniref:Cytochrome P450 2J2-like n=1 Tax=Eublepharis macularius TaxID=481883 RepID=A0AA97L1U7_EUBMA|nr:cytochrome P450 2J2-like [Eublepharis macularius]